MGHPVYKPTESVSTPLQYRSTQLLLVKDIFVRVQDQCVKILGRQACTYAEDCRCCQPTKIRARTEQMCQYTSQLPYSMHEIVYNWNATRQAYLQCCVRTDSPTQTSLQLLPSHRTDLRLTPLPLCLDSRQAYSSANWRRCHHILFIKK